MTNYSSKHYSFKYAIYCWWWLWYLQTGICTRSIRYPFNSFIRRMVWKYKTFRTLPIYRQKKLRCRADEFTALKN
jgi:hypothetical protein